MQEALLTQKIEFLEIELAEARTRECKLRESNEALMELLNSAESGFLSVISSQEQIIIELRKSNDQYKSEIKSLKKTGKYRQTGLESRIQELQIQNKELVLDFKQ